MLSDVVIVGGGIAGCTAALLFARHGLKVTVVEKKKRIEEYKKLCTHFIQPSALPVMRRLRLDQAIEAAGGLPNKADIWTKAGWIRSGNPYCYGKGMEHGYNIERRILDPLLRTRLYEDPLIQYVPDGTVIGVNSGLGQEHHVTYLNRDGQRSRLDSRLIVAADGRFSNMARLVDNEGSKLPNNRFVCFAYFKNVTLTAGGHSQFWTLDPDMAFAYPLVEDTTLICLFIRKSEWKSWREQLEKIFMSYIDGLPDAPDMSRAVRISNIYSMFDMANISRMPSKNGVAFVGDAALSLDPMSGVGCAFAFQSAEWLVDHTCGALLEGREPGPSLQAYRECHERQLSPHAAGIQADSLAEPDDGSKIRLYSEIIRDPELIDSFLALTGRIITPQAFQVMYLKKMLEKRKESIRSEQQ